MTLFFPDLNVWIALSVAGHTHTAPAWTWLQFLGPEARLVFSRYTHVGLLRLLTNPAVMGERVLNIEQAWAVYERWLADPRVAFHPEPRGLDAAFRAASTAPPGQAASKWIGDSYLLACAQESAATLVTFDQALYRYARKHRYAAIVPA